MSTPTDLSALSKSGSGQPHTTAMPRPPLRWKTRVLLPAVLIVCFASIFAYALRDSLLPSTRVRVVPVVVKAALGGDAAGVVAQAAGWIEPDPYPIFVTSLTDGFVKEVTVLEGQRVKAGDVIARLIDDDAKLALDFAENELKHHTHDLCEKNAVIKAAQTEWDNPVERNRALAANTALLAQAQADVAANTFEQTVEDRRVKELEEQHRIEKRAFDGHALPESQLNLTTLKLETQRAALQLVTAKRAALVAKVAQLEAEVAASKRNLELRITESKELDVAIAQKSAELHTIETIRVKRDEAKLRLARTEIRTPVDGVVLERMVEPGAKLAINMNEKSSSQVAKLYDPKRLQARVDVPLADAAKISAGQQARVVVEVLRDTVFEGVVTRVSHQADISKNTLQCKVAIQNPREELRPEMLARIQFLAFEKPGSKSNEPAQRLFAQENLIKNNNAWIWDKGHNTAVKRAVTLGSAKLNGWIEITAGLQPGDALLDGETLGLAEGQRITVIEDAATPAPTPADHKH